MTRPYKPGMTDYIQQLNDDHESFEEGIGAIATAVRFEEQTLTDEQQDQARDNLSLLDSPVFTGKVSAGSISLAKNIAYSGVLGAANTGLFFDGNASGASSSILTPLNFIRFNSDTVSVPTAGIVDAFHVYHNFGGAGCVGARTGTQTTLVMTATPDTNTHIDSQHVVDLQIGLASASHGGSGTTSATAVGSMFGSNPNVRLASGATNWYALIGSELNVALATGASVAHKVGAIIVATSSDKVQGNETDSALVIANQSGAVGWKKGISFGRADGIWPISSTGTIIGTNAQLYGTPVSLAAAHGIDFSAVTFSADAFKSTGFVVSGTGAVTATSFAGPLTGNVTGNVSGTSGSTTGNAATATALQNARTINGVSFDGTGNITVAAAAGTLTGSSLPAGVTASSLTSVGTLAALTVTATITGSVSGNAGTATALQNARAINGTSFDGTGNITVSAAAGTLTGTTLNSTVVNASLSAITASGGTLAVTGAMTVSGAVVGPAVYGATNTTVSIGNVTNGVGFVVEDAGSAAVNHWSVYGSATGARPTLRARSSTAVSANIQNGAAAPIIFGTDADATAREQVRINHTAGATNYITLTGSNGANPTISTSAGDLFVGTGLIGAAYAEMTSYVKAYKGTAIPAGGTAGAGFTLSSTANFGVFFGSGAPTLSAAKGSLYLRSDGSGTGDRAYINTNGSTTWTALTTAA